MLSVVNSNNRYAKMYQYLTLSFCHKINTAPLRPGAGLAAGWRQVLAPLGISEYCVNNIYSIITMLPPRSSL